MAIDPKLPHVILRFGGGLNSQDSPTDIDPRECSAGENFDLPTSNTFLSVRKSVTQVGSAPNGASVCGFVQLIKTDGTRSFLVQAGPDVYEWDGSSGSGGMTSVGAVNSSARLRGTIEANSVKDDKVYIADLNLSEVVYEWDGTTFQPLVHDLGGTLKARYALVAFERLILGNLDDAGTLLPHVMAASKQDDFSAFTVANKPSSSRAANDPFYLPMSNNAPLKGMIEAFRKVVFATGQSNWYTLDGADATDHSLGILYTGASVKGDEALAFIGNDIVFGKQGGIDSLSATERFGDIQADDLTRWICGEVVEVTSWSMVYLSRLDRLYCIPSGGGTIYVLHKGFLDGRVRFSLFGSETVDISPWSKWKTVNAFNFGPTASMKMISPTDGLEYAYLGDGSGNIWQTEAATATDNGSAITMTRTSLPFSIPATGIYKLEGWVKSRRLFGGNITITALIGGKELHDHATTVTLDAAANTPVWGGGSYWGGGAYWGVSLDGRLSIKEWTVSGAGGQVQLQVSISSDDLGYYNIEEIGLQFRKQN